MSDTAHHHHHGDHAHAHGTSVKWVPLLMAVGLVVFTLAVVTFANVTGLGVVHTGANAITNTGLIQVERDTAGTIMVVGADSDEIIASYPRTQNQFLAGALRSLQRMTPAVEESTRTFAVLRIGSGSVFLEDVQTGDRISLNAFNRGEALALAERVAAQNGGQK